MSAFTPPASSQADRLPPEPSADEDRMLPEDESSSGFDQGFRSIGGREQTATEDGVRIYLRDMAKTRLISRTEELDLAFRIVALRTRFQSLLLDARPAGLEGLRWMAERDDRVAALESSVTGSDGVPRTPRATAELDRLAARL